MKFKFSLESVLTVRKHEEKVQKQKLAEKLSEKNNLLVQREKLKEKLKSHIESSDHKKFEKLHNLRRFRGCIEEMHQKMENLNDCLEVIENAVNKERDKLLVVHRKRNIIEKLKEEEHSSFLKEVLRYQRRVMDEVAVQTHSQ